MKIEAIVTRTFSGLLLLALAGCSKDAADSVSQRRDNNIAEVTVTRVNYTTESTRVEAVGTSRAIQSVILMPKVSGEVMAVNFEPGQRVEKDRVLLELDSRDEKLAVELAGIRVEDAERLYQRYQRIDGTGAVLPTTLDAAKATLDAARIELQRAMIALNDRVIKAPFTGYVGLTDIDTGDRVDESTAITTLDNRDTLLVDFEVPEVMVGSLGTGDEIQISSWNDQSSLSKGRIVNLGSRIDPVTRTFTVRASVDNPDDRLRPGMSFRVSLNISGKLFAVVPEISLQWGTEGSYVWQVSDNQAVRVPASVIQRQKGQILVDADIAEGSLIVVEGVQRLHEGMEVKYSGDEEAPPFKKPPVFSPIDS